MTRRVIGPFNRVEGDLEVRLDVDDGVVSGAEVSASMFRGFEHILTGRPMMDAISITPRICGICSVSQSVATARALGDALGLEMPENGQLGINLVHAAENLADHLTHFYLFFMPDFTRAVYAQREWFDDASRRFSANAGTAQRQALAARARLLNITGILAGKWPHTLAIQPTGLTHAPDDSACMRLKSAIADTRAFFEDAVFGQPLEAIWELTDAGALDRALDRAGEARSDFAAFGAIARGEGLAELGKGVETFMSAGAYFGVSADDGGPAFRPGLFAKGSVTALDLESLREDVTHGWYAGDALHPSVGETRVDAERAGAYSWAKAPRLDGRAVEVGAIARQVVHGHPLARDLLKDGRADVFSRIIGRMVESAGLIRLMEDWAARLSPNAPVASPDAVDPDCTAQGVGLVEAARGALGHWLDVKDGRIRRYQIVAPTTWNFSPRDERGLPGPVEQALAGTALGNDGEDVRAQHVVRSFDPCMACTVH